MSKSRNVRGEFPVTDEIRRTMAEQYDRIVFSKDLRLDNIRCATFHTDSPLAADGLMIGMIDVTRKDADRLIGCIVAVHTVCGLEAMKVVDSRRDGVYLLRPLRSDVDPLIVQPDGEGSILGRVVRWIGTTPLAHCEESGSRESGSRRRRRS